MSDILLPELGEGIDSVEIRDVLVNKGDLIKKNQTMVIGNVTNFYEVQKAIKNQKCVFLCILMQILV